MAFLKKVTVVYRTSCQYQIRRERELYAGRNPFPHTIKDTPQCHAMEQAHLRDDILFGTRTAPDFQHAVRLARLMNDVITSAKSGARMSAAD